jgi:hypothetical protein
MKLVELAMIWAKIVKSYMEVGLRQNCTFLNIFLHAEKSQDSEEVKYHLRGKGIPKDQLTMEMFEEMMAGKSIKIEMQRNFKRIHVNKNSKQKAVENFSILQLDALEKQINSIPWKGRHFVGNSSVPIYHNSIN